MPKYSIITIALNSLSHTIKCVESVLKNTKDFELIIVDNVSDDGTSGYLDEIARGKDFIKIVRLETRKDFSAANNIGLKLATGDYIVFLNNDTIVCKDWCDRIHAHFDRVPLKNIGCIGPVSSSSNGKQMVGPQDPEAWHAQNHGHWTHTGVLYGWCMMIPRPVLDKVGGFDERFSNSHEDNDLCLRIQLAGYKLVIAYDTYIDHVGQGTLRNFFDKKGYLESGYKNREIYYNKWAPILKSEKLVAVYRTNAGVWFERSLAQTSKFADSIIIHFCRAPHEFSREVHGDMTPATREEYVNYLKMKFPKIVKIEFYDGIFQEDYERGWLLQEALKMFEAGQADWCISVDDDELYEDKFIERVRAMMNPRNPEVFGYWCQWRTIWETRLGKEYYRTDSTFGQFSNYRFFRLMHGQEIVSKHPEGHHCGSAPLIAEENLRWSNIRVKHMGYDTPEQRQKKFEFYQANDHFKTKADIGYEDYSHLIELNVQLQEYRPDAGISCVMMVKNEEDMIIDCLEQVQNLVDEYVIVDTGSTDRTKEMIERFAAGSPVPVKVLDYPWENQYSTPRNFGKSHATKRHILHLDADERINYHEVIDVFRCMEADPDVVIFHVLNYLEPIRIGVEPKYASTESARLFRNIPEIFWTGVIHETLDDSLLAFRSKRGLKLMRFPGMLHHYGYLRSKERVRAKLDYYEALNNKQIEVTNDTDPRPHFNLAMHYLQDNKEVEAMKAFQRSLAINPKFWHSSQQMAALNIKNARIFLGQVIQNIPSQHPFRQEAIELINFMEKKSFGCQKVV